MSQDAFDRFEKMAKRTIYPWIDDKGQEWDIEDVDYDDLTDEDWDDSYDDSMDGDFDSGMSSAGFGTDEDYGYYGEDY